MLGASKSDPVTLASLMVQLGRTNDPRTWSEIQQTLGNGQAQKIREAIAQQTAGTAAAKPAESAVDTLPIAVNRDVLGVKITAPAGVRLASLEEVTRIVQTEVGKNAYAQQHFAQAKVTIVIIPAHEELTDAVDMSKVKDQKTFDGRDWKGVRGMGGTQTPDGHFTMAVAEENVVNVADVKSAYPATYSIAMHELAHVLEAKGMDDSQQSRVKALYANHLKADPGDANGTFTDWYGAENEREYFAQSTNAFFDRNVMPTDPRYHSGRAFLQKNDPDMYAFLVELYDTPRDKHDKAT